MNTDKETIVYSTLPVTIDEMISSRTNNTLHLQLPTKGAFEEKVRALNYNYNKDDLERIYGPAVQKLRKHELKVVLHGTDGLCSYYNTHVFGKILNGTTNLLKASYVNFAAVIRSFNINVMGLCDALNTPKGLEEMEREVRRGGLPIPELAQTYKLKINRYGWSSWAKYDSLSDPSPVSELVKMSDIVNSVKDVPEEVTVSRYRDMEDFLVPTPNLILYTLCKEQGHYPRLATKEFQSGERKIMWEVNDELLAQTMSTMKGLLATGVIANGKTKLPINVVKRVRKEITIPALPEISPFDFTDTTELLTLLFALVGREKIKGNDTFESVLRKIYEVSKSYNHQLVWMWLSNSIEKPTASFFDNTFSQMRAFLSVISEVIALAAEEDEKWISLNSFSDCVDSLAAERGGVYYYPYDEYGRLIDIYLPGSRPLSVCQVKRHYHDVIIQSMLLTFAAIGGMELQMDDDGAWWLRVSPLGRWYCNRELPFPLHFEMKQSRNDFEVNDELKLIRVKDPKSPYLSLLKDYAKQVSPTRFLLTEKALLGSCQKKAVLKKRIALLTENILGKPGPEIQAFFKSLEERFDKVEPTPGGSTYKLFDIDRSDKKLRDLILSDEDIMQHSLRVEGCRLLVKNSYIDKFFEKLQAAGYPCERK